MISRIIAMFLGVLIILPETVFPQMSDRDAWIIFQVIITLALVEITMRIPKDEVVVRSGYLVMTIYAVTILVTDWFLPHIPDYFYALESLVFLLWFSYNIGRVTSGYTSNELNNTHIFITFYKPQTFGETLTALFGLPFSSVGVYSEGRWLRFRRNRSNLVLVNARPTQPKYIAINTGIKIDDSYRFVIEELVGIPARHWTSLYFRCRCVVALRPLLNKLGDRWKPGLLDFIPAIYAYRRLVNGREKS